MSADFWAGYVSGAAGIIIGNPLDLVKTRLQAGKTIHPAVDVATTAAATQSFRGQFENAGTLVRGEETYTLSRYPMRPSHSELVARCRELTRPPQYRRNSTYPRLRRAQRPPLRHIQPHTHFPLRVPRIAHLLLENMARGRNRRPRVVCSIRPNGTHKMPRAGRD